jgi:hypothetical protein
VARGDGNNRPEGDRSRDSSRNRCEHEELRAHRHFLIQHLCILVGREEGL